MRCYRFKLFALENLYAASGSMFPTGKLTKYRTPLEGCDPNSQDSGFGAEAAEMGESSKGPKGLRCTLSVGAASRLRTPFSCSKPRSPSSGYDSTDDGFTESIDIGAYDEEARYPNGLSSLLSELIMSSEKPMGCGAALPEIRPKSSCRDSLSPQNENSISSTSGTRISLYQSPDSTSSTAMNDSPNHSMQKSFKHSELPFHNSPRGRISISLGETSKQISLKQTALMQTSLNETEIHAGIKSAIERSTTDADLTGDFSKRCVLPLVHGHQGDLMSISTETLAALMRGEFKHLVNSFKVVDCRYPYEYEAGHIEDALNLYTKDMIEQQLLDPLTGAAEIQPVAAKRDILVIHCELSWERGPILSRFLRSIDRKRNKEYYPALHYPEIYLLQGGYQQFYYQQKELCSPQGYKPMFHPDCKAEMRKFRCKTKNEDGHRSKSTVQPKRIRLRL